MLLPFVTFLLLVGEFSPLMSEKVDLGCLCITSSLFDVSCCSLAGFQFLS